jgi:hypothetical protein
MEKVTAFNNAGVSCFEKGHPSIAWDLFKGALEAKLALEKCDYTRFAADPSKHENYLQLAGNNKYIKRAEYHFCHLDQYGALGTEGGAYEAEESSSMSSSSATQCSETMTSDGSFAPFLFSRPIRLSPSDINTQIHDYDSSSGLSQAHSECAVMIFNLAMVAHVHGTPHSVDHGKTSSTIALYNLASSLVAGQCVSTTLGVALMNNIGCWFFEHDNQDAGQRCMELVSRMLHPGRSSRGRLALNEQELQGLTSNIVNILNPAHTASPAA